MEWTDDAIVLGVRKHGETSVIAELMTRYRGRHLGLVQGGRGRAMRPLLQPGNAVRATWRARLDEHLGQYKLEITKSRAAVIMEQAHCVYALQTLAAHLRLLPERDAHEALYNALDFTLDHLDQSALAGELVIRFELALLEELGFGLDLSACAATGTKANLHYVSPRTGRAVSRSAGEPWGDRLLVLPSFLTSNEMPRVEAADKPALEAGFELTTHFFERHVSGPRGVPLPSERASFIRLVTQSES
ncbi:MAG: DNA repair protein RecO [Pseudomonadota bacterium]